MNATRDFLEDGAALGKLTLDYTVNGRQEVERHFFGPGGDFLNYVFNWDHYIRLPRPKSELKQRSAKKMTPK